MARLEMNLHQVARAVSGVLHGGGDAIIESVFTDSRQKVERALFFALRGPRFDGHNYVVAAQNNGALSVMVEKKCEGITIPQIVVKDTLAALGALAATHRRAFGGKVIAITGSSGKTTTRRMIASILGQCYPVHQPIRNFNNHVGVPLTLLALEPRHSAAVIELGCSDFNEIGPLTLLSQPDVALITNVGPAHLEKLGNLEGVAKAKGELFQQIDESATAVINDDDPYISKMPLNTKRHLVFGTGKATEVKLLERRPNRRGGQVVVLDILGESVTFSLPLPGAHNAKNALAAAAAARACGMDNNTIIKGLESVQAEEGRLNIKPGPGDTSIIDDTYNSNPASAKAALEMLSETATEGRKWAVLGDMLELGEHFEAEHERLGGHAAKLSIDRLITVGKGGAIIDRGAKAAGLPDDVRFHTIDKTEAVALLLRQTEAGDLVLVKGSRGMHMEEIVLSFLKGNA